MVVVNEQMMALEKKLRLSGRESTAMYYKSLFNDVAGLITVDAVEKWPDALSLPEQAILILGFQHQREWNFERSASRKEAQMNGSNNEADGDYLPEE